MCLILAGRAHSWEWSEVSNMVVYGLGSPSASTVPR